MDIFEVLSEVETLVETSINETFKSVSAEALGLDNRCGTLYIDKDSQVIAVSKSGDRRLNYYGGFEYIAEDCKFEIGDYVFYHNDERVEKCFDFLSEAK